MDNINIKEGIDMRHQVRSMTGYGRGEYLAQDRKFVVEMKSVNHRYHDLNIKLPRVLASLEDNIKKRIAKDVFRGKTDVYITFETFSTEDVEVKLNEGLAKAYAEKIHVLEDMLQEKVEDIVSLTARFPDVIVVEKAQKEEEVMWAGILPALEQALESFVAMRQTEGENLKQDILQKANRIQNLVDDVKVYAPTVVVEYQEKLQNRLKELMDKVDVDPQRLAMEVAIFADKGCIDEELIRLDSHLKQLHEILEQGGQVGRKLDFLVQEMNRESNTIASKANDIRIVKATIELKSEIEKIREQIQNLE